MKIDITFNDCTPEEAKGLLAFASGTAPAEAKAPHREPPARKKRKTNAEIEADKAAEEAAKEPTNVETIDPVEETPAADPTVAAPEGGPSPTSRRRPRPGTAAAPVATHTNAAAEAGAKTKSPSEDEILDGDLVKAATLAAAAKGADFVHAVMAEFGVEHVGAIALEMRQEFVDRMAAGE